MLNFIVIAGNVGLLVSGLFPAPIEANAIETGCDWAMFQTPGLFAEELKEGEGKSMSGPRTATIHFTIEGVDGKKSVDSSRRGLPFSVAFGDDAFWTPILWEMKKGERRRVVWTPVEGAEEKTVVVELIAFVDRKPSAKTDKTGPSRSRWARFV